MPDLTRNSGRDRGSAIVRAAAAVSLLLIPFTLLSLMSFGQAPEFGSKNGIAKFTVTGDGQRHWYRVNVRSADGKLLAITNPIYVNFAR